MAGLVPAIHADERFSVGIICRRIQPQGNNIMDAQLEALVTLYLTRGGKVFISPQYDIPYSESEKDGGACPDIVALDMEKRELVFVEVSSAANLGDLYKKIRERQARWYAPIQRRLEADKILEGGWKPRFLGFIRRDLVKGAKGKFSEAEDVCFFPLEEAAFSFAYWTEREKGLPR